MGQHDGDCAISQSRPMCHCASRRLVVHVVDATSLVFVLILQASILNYYIIQYYKSSVGPYFWFIGDFICLFIFAGTLTTSYRYLTRCKECHPCQGEKSFYMSPKRIVANFPTSKLGMLPLSYVSWFLYSCMLLAKVIIIFKSEIPEQLSPTEAFGPQLLQIAIAMSGIIFLLLVEGHNWAERGSPRYIYVTGVCGKTGIEILDTVSLLSILLLASTQSFLTTTLENAVIILSAFNFFLPVLALYKLSLCDFAAHPFSLPIAVLHNLLHLCLVDVPFLCVRVYLWVYYKQHASIFIMKNVFSIILVLRGMYPDLVKLIQMFCRIKPSDADKKNGNATELEGLNKQSGSADNFEEINLGGGDKDDNAPIILKQKSVVVTETAKISA
ncbi:hypothetical protein ONE63_005714 [Megalurothrips usitatus]|uniref:Uncharacterized protein n=1 Tax=Megalurothrips usitatus TaxID=439358 RepID=A0AAV7Y1B8_9NEOP|nr:hypothetical protein ONE63_005714 [Megalurothrips usitatus]